MFKQLIKYLLTASYKKYKLITYKVTRFIILSLSNIRKALNLKPNMTIYEGKVDIKKNDLLCIFSHFDADNIIDDYVVYYLEKIKELNCSIIFVSTASKIGPKELSKIEHLVAKIIIKDNIGYDFGAYATGLEIAKEYSHFNKVILANDSVYGPFSDLMNVLHKMEKEKLDVIGLTDNWEYSYHLQSYFIILNRQVLNHPKVENFWHNVPLTNNKKIIIRECEIGFSRMLLRQGFKLGALCSYVDIIVQAIKDKKLPANATLVNYYCNPTHYFWDILIYIFDYPFIKIELIKYNPAKIKNVWAWKDVIEGLKLYNVQLALNHLKRTFKGKQ